jgi:PPK2 family polyphosphate:nucleotide phosphotransferase
MKIKRYRVDSGKKVSLKDFDTRDTGPYSAKDEAAEDLRRDVERLAELQDVLYAQSTYSLLLVFQAMDAAGKDSAIKHVMSGINPQGCQVFSFKAPSAEELDHDYMWRCMKSLPERGRIGTFNRSYYEEVLVVRVHPEYLKGQSLPPEVIKDSIWEKRYEDINNIEKYLVRNGTIILKFFLHVSKKEQKDRFLERIDDPEKNWKFSMTDVKERGHWDEYMKAYEEMLEHTGTEWAPWYVIPADRKWFTRAAVARVIIETLEGLDLQYPVLSEKQKAELASARDVLLHEDSGQQPTATKGTA